MVCFSRLTDVARGHGASLSKCLTRGALNLKETKCLVGSGALLKSRHVIVCHCPVRERGGGAGGGVPPVFPIAVQLEVGSEARPWLGGQVTCVRRV